MCIFIFGNKEGHVVQMRLYGGTLITSYKMSGFHGSENLYSCILGYDAM